MRRVAVLGIPDQNPLLYTRFAFNSPPLVDMKPAAAAVISVSLPLSGSRKTLFSSTALVLLLARS